MSSERVAPKGVRPRRPTIPSRTISIPYGDGLPADVDVQGVVFQAVKRPDGGATFLVCDTTDDARKLFAAIRSAGHRAYYQNYTLYFRYKPTPDCSPVALRTVLQEALAPAQMTDFRAYTRPQGDRYVLRGDGQFSIDRHADLLDLLERKELKIEENTLSVYPYRPKKVQVSVEEADGASFGSPYRTSAVSIEQAVSAAVKAVVSAALQSQSERAATFDTEFA